MYIGLWSRHPAQVPSLNGGLTRTWAICNDHLPLCVVTAVGVEQLRQAQDGLNAFDYYSHCLKCVPSENYKFLVPSED